MESIGLKTSAIFWIEVPVAGRMAIVARPRGGDWLEDEVKGLRGAGIDILVSLLTPDEETELQLVDEGRCCAASEIEFLQLPIHDRGVPASRESFLALSLRLIDSLHAGKVVGIHCRAGIGRSALLAASVLILLGLSPAMALERIGQARQMLVPETPEQRDWLESFARKIPPFIQTT